MNPLSFDGILWLTWAAGWYLAAAFVPRNKSTQGAWGKFVPHLLMAAGFFMLFHASQQSLVYGHLYDNIWVGYAGTALTVMGLLLAVWARLHLGRHWSGVAAVKQDHKIIRAGPYAAVRHPIYTGFCVAGLGTALSAATGDGFVGAGLLLGACLVKIRSEEALLMREFGEEYRRYRREVRAIIPFIL